MINLRKFLAAAAVLMAVAPACVARPVPTSSVDRLPREDWSYDAMIHLAGRGLVPGMTSQRFIGDWLYDRQEMATFVREAIESAGDSAPASDKALLRKLAMEFRGELISAGAGDALAKADSFEPVNADIAAGYVLGGIRRQDGDTDLTSLYRVTGIDSRRKYLTGVVTLSDERRREDSPAFSRLDKALVRFKSENWEGEFGKDYMWYGPGYGGSMILSDNSPAFVFGRVGKDFNFGKHIGYIKITQFASSFEDNHARYFLYGRRFQKQLSPQWHVGVSETAKTTDIKPNPLIALLPSFYLYQRIFRDNVDTEFNDLVSVDVTYKSKKIESYVDFLVDDMQAPKGLYTGPEWDLPRKVGYLVGVYLPDVLRDGKSSFRAEYIQTDAGTYQATRPEFPGLAYTHDDFVIGHPAGSNSKAVFLRADRKLSNWAAAAEYFGRCPHESGGPGPDDTSRTSLLAVRDLTPRGSLTLRYDRFKLPETENRLQLSASYAF